jgi:hypothetical protein
MISILYIFLFSTILQSNVFLQTGKNKTDDENWSQIDEHVLNAPHTVENRVQSLSEYFLEVAKTDSEKARAIYRWITDRISYDLDTFFRGDLNNITGKEVLRTRKAVCSGYVVLFVELADAIGLKVEIISGHSKGYGFDPVHVSYPVENHSWVAARIGDEWRLIDPTWGAGHIRADTREFVKVFSEFYFFADPDLLIYTHLPLDDKWQLRTEPVTRPEYFGYAMVSPHFFHYDLRFGEDSRLYIDTDGKYTARFTVPDNVVVQCMITHTESGFEENPLIRFKESRLDIFTFLSRTGEYKIELYAREINDDSGFFNLVTYYYLNNKSAETIKSYPKVMGYYENSRASLVRPLKYTLTDTMAYDFEITIPGAEEAYLTNSTLEWYTLERDNQRFYGTTTPGSGKILLVARFPGDDFYSVMVEFEGN